MKYFYLIWKNMTRKKVRVILTLLSIVVAFTLYGMLASLAGLFSGEMRFFADDRLFVTAKHGGTLPVSYANRLRLFKPRCARLLTPQHSLVPVPITMRSSP